MNIQEQMRLNRIPTWFSNMLGTFPNDPRPRVSVIWGPTYRPSKEYSKEYREAAERYLQRKAEIEARDVAPLLEEKLKTLSSLLKRPIVWEQQIGRIRRHIREDIFDDYTGPDR